MRNNSLQRENPRFSESISKRNYSANILNKTLDKRFRIKSTNNDHIKSININVQNNNIQNQNNNYFNYSKNYDPGNIECKNLNNTTGKHKQNNLEKFLFLNQQFKDDNKKKNIIAGYRNITSAEPTNMLKTKLSQKIGKILNNNFNPPSATFKKRPSEGNTQGITTNNLSNLVTNHKKIVSGGGKYNANSIINDHKSKYPKTSGYVIYNGNETPSYINPYSKSPNNLQNLNYNYNNSFFPGKSPYEQNLNYNYNKINSNNKKKQTILSGGNPYYLNNPMHKTFIPPLIQNKEQKKNILKKPFKEYYVKLYQNTRESMEDFHLVSESFNDKGNQALFGVFDGHGGIEVAQKLKNEISGKLAKLINSNTPRTPDLDSCQIESNFKTLFKKFDEEIIKQFSNVNQIYESTNFQSPGSTCTLIYLIKEEKETFLYSANIGDTKGLLISKTGSSRITYEHKPTDDFENKRVKSNGGVIFSGRIFGQFGLTRAFGNIPLKKWVIAEPFIKKSIIHNEDKFIVVASDGIWDVITDEECFEISIKHQNPKEFCEELVNTSLSRWSKDNISCIVIQI